MERRRGACFLGAWIWNWSNWRRDKLELRSSIPQLLKNTLCICTILGKKLLIKEKRADRVTSNPKSWYDLCEKISETKINIALRFKDLPAMNSYERRGKERKDWSEKLEIGPQMIRSIRVWKSTSFGIGRIGWNEILYCVCFIWTI